MRFAHSVVAVCILLLAVPSWGKRPPQSSSTTGSTSAPQAVAVVQAAITALGGATAIAQAQSWTLQASLQGPSANGNASYTITTAKDIETYTPTPGGANKPAPRIRSLFVPVAIASILLSESQDSRLVFTYRGPLTLAGENITVIDVHLTNGPLSVQTWCFDATTNLPVSVDFRMPAQIGQRVGIPGIVNLSDYQTVSGVSYPFQVTAAVAGSLLPQTITIQSVTPSTAIIQSNPSPAAGDLADLSH